MEKINNTQSGKGYLFRVSASEICNYDCRFCHPSTTESVLRLSDDEFLRIFSVINSIYKLKTLHFTGGEPLTRKTLPYVIRECRKMAGDDLDIAITTNASLLLNLIPDLKDAGLSRMNISLHSIDTAKYQSFTGSSTDVETILSTIREAKKVGFGVKINSVVIRDFNDMDVCKLAEWCFSENIIPRFLELGIYGPVSKWFSAKDQVSHEEIVRILTRNFGSFNRDYTSRGNGPSKYYINSQGNIFGILDNQSDKLCRGCDRFRMSANGYIKVCNFPPIDLREHMDSIEEIKDAFLQLGHVLDSRGNDYIGKRLHRNDYYFRWNHPELNNSNIKEGNNDEE